jgi:EAL domain-containing protein (putative c-di-GMP-specific phosphodiesterase class I)/CheY-like chemotaxis protein
VFGRRKVRPRVCIVDAKQHIRTFLGETLEELDFITCECAEVGQLGAVLDTRVPDLVMTGLSAGGIDACEVIKVLASHEFDGKVLLFGQRVAYSEAAIREFAQDLGIVILPTLRAPFSTESLREIVSTLLPSEAPPHAPIDVAEAVASGWLELWYQPKFDMNTLCFSGAEALIRIHHPTWGIVLPAYFIPDYNDPHCRALSEFVIRRAMDDWRQFVVQHGRVEIAINLPIPFFQNEDAVAYLCEALPDHPAFDGLIVEVDGAEAMRNLELAKDVARRLRFHSVAISVDGLGAEWPWLRTLQDFPFVEVKVDRKFVGGCAHDPLKRMVCHRICEIADGFGARTVAEGVESRADFLAIREMGFNLVQGFLFAKPMRKKKFTQTVLRHPAMMPM